MVASHGPPSRIGKYEVASRIGRGGMATVYRARLRVVGVAEKTVSLKLLHPHLANEQDFLALFVNEMRVAMGMSHRNVVQTFDAGEADGHHFMVMELVDGCSLRQLLGRIHRTGTALPIELALFITMEVCAALDYAHHHPTGEGQVGVFHRDVSPSNILLSADGDVKLADFGVAKAAGRLTVVADVIKGKLSYMAPEQARGQVDARSDLFSLGAVLYESLTGRPMRRDSSLEAVRYHRGADSPPSQHRSGLPPGLDDLIASCLAPDPSDRPPSAAALRDRAAQLAFDLQISGAGSVDPQMRLRAFLRDGMLETDRKDSPRPGAGAGEGNAARVVQAMLEQALEVPTDLGTLAAHPEANETQRTSTEPPTEPATNPTPARQPVVALDAQPTIETPVQAVDAADEFQAIASPPRHRGLILAAVVALLLLSVVVLWLATRPSSDGINAHGVADAASSADAAGAASPAGSLPAAAASEDGEPELVRDAAATNDGAVGGSADALATIDISTVISRPPVRQRPRPRPAKSKTGSLDINSAPWAKVYVDGRYRGATPLQGIVLPVGRHRVRLFNPKLRITRRLTVTILAGQRTQEAVRLTAPK